MNQPSFPIVAGGFLPQSAAPGEKIQTVRGCEAVKGSTGAHQIQLNSPYSGYPDDQLIIVANVRSAPSFGGFIGITGVSNGLFIIQTRRVDTQVEVDLAVSFAVMIIPSDR